MYNILFLSVFNDGCMELAHNHLLSLQNAHITNYIGYTTGYKSYIKLKSLKFNVIYNKTSYTNDKVLFDTKEFCNLSYLRYKIILGLLDKFDYIWYLDVDTFVKEGILTNITKLLNKYDKVDILCQDDITMLCTGCMLIKNNNENKKTLKLILDNQNNEINDQILFNSLINKKLIKSSILLLSKYEYINGLCYFDDIWLNINENYKKYKQKYKKKSLAIKKNIYFIHANFILGNDNKILALKNKNLWLI